MEASTLDLFLDLLSDLECLFLLLHLAHLGQHDLAEDGALDGLGQRSLTIAASGSRAVVGVAAADSGYGRFPGLVSRRDGVGRHIGVFRVVLLHLERLDPVCELDELDTAS